MVAVVVEPVELEAWAMLPTEAPQGAAPVTLAEMRAVRDSVEKVAEVDERALGEAGEKVLAEAIVARAKASKERLEAYPARQSRGVGREVG